MNVNRSGSGLRIDVSVFGAASRHRALGRIAHMLRSVGRAGIVLTAAAVMLAPSGPAQGATVFSQAPSASAPSLMTSAASPIGDATQYVYDSFTLSSAETVTGITWRGGYQGGAPSSASSGTSGEALGFTVSIYAIAFPLMPDTPEADSGLVARYQVTGNAGEGRAETSDGNLWLYDYRFTLPTSFHAKAGTKYWLSIAATRPGWGWATATAGSGSTPGSLFFNQGAAKWFASSSEFAFSLLTATP